MRGRARKTWAVVLASTALHGALALALLTRPTPKTLGVADVAPMTIALMTPTPGPPREAETPPRPARPEPTDTAAPQPQDAPPEAAAPAAMPASAQPAPGAEPDPASPVLAGGGEGGCAVQDAVMAAFREPPVQAAVARIPRAARSVANAVMLWDGRWVTSGALADVAVAQPIRRAIAETVRQAPPACANAPVSGPVFLILPDETGAIVVVLGSGAWRWSDLEAPAAD